MLLSTMLLLAGMALLFWTGDFLVKGAVGLAENLGIPQLVIGLTVVAFGTSAPELFISVQAALAGQSGIAVGNVVGSNIANVLLVIGLPALLAPILADQAGLRRNMLAMIGLTVVFLWLLSNGVIGRLEGGLLFAGLCAFIGWQIYEGITADQPVDHDFHEELGDAPHTGWKVAFYLVIGIVGLPLAAQLTIAGAVDIAEYFDISDAVIGLTVIAIGTSLPELATTLMAAIRNSGSVAIGNIVGSNIFNLAAIMGLTALIAPVTVADRIILVDMWVMLATSLLLAALAFARITSGKVMGVAMLAAFGAYIASFLY
ncbi:calcium/sodium antiporter [Chelativorans sp. ZYF759]|uniref:calcium/sodium antiporter n=1 Tax=Chelativorans sp. ZYF759 TaxID=2692213 RepID=UPI00145ECDC8|nr:calcium/sodium antiporter [Chelativorans sp. ZYF759]NMG38719.1 calcium/sodium antiporter [Chelativorans sp. ZYF759]